MSHLRRFLRNACWQLTRYPIRYKEGSPITGVTPNPLKNKHCKVRNACNGFAADEARIAKLLAAERQQTEVRCQP